MFTVNRTRKQLHFSAKYAVGDSVVAEVCEI